MMYAHARKLNTHKTKHNRAAELEARFEELRAEYSALVKDYQRQQVRVCVEAFGCMWSVCVWGM